MLTLREVTRLFGGGRTLLGGRRPQVHALQAVSLELAAGETLGIVGESGCGKSTLARLIVGLDRPTRGHIRLQGDGRPTARRVQYVFQDPVAALNPRKTIRRILEAPLIHLLGMERGARQRRVAELMAAVSLDAQFLDRYPHEFSGGQAQRIGIARALAAEPELMVLDEPVSALDVSMQAQVLNMLDELKQHFGLTYLFISHDLSVVESVSQRVAVMYFGRIVESGPTRELFSHPRHPYTRLLLDSAPVPGKPPLGLDESDAELPDPYNPPPGCAFYPRCPRGGVRCRQERPLLESKSAADSHTAACHFPLETSFGNP
nr:ABC transporter ATP-binding protein [Sedimenticola hydrogenitrophicus]